MGSATAILVSARTGYSGEGRRDRAGDEENRADHEANDAVDARPAARPASPEEEDQKKVRRLCGESVESLWRVCGRAIQYKMQYTIQYKPGGSGSWGTLGDLDVGVVGRGACPQRHRAKAAYAGFN